MSILLTGLIVSAISLIHSPIPVDRSRSLEAEAHNKPVLAERVLHEADSVIVFDNNPGQARAQGSPGDPDYAVYGYRRMKFDLGGMSLSDFNRLALDIEPDCPGMRVVNITLSFDNSESTGPGFNPVPGEHLINLENHNLCRYYLEVADLRRDCMRSLCISVTLRGMDLEMPGPCRIHIRRIAAQRVASTEKVSGWLPDPGTIVYSMSGYDVDGAKTAIVNACDICDTTTFKVLRPDGSAAYSSPVRRVETSTGTFGVLDFSALRLPGTYTLCCGKAVTHPFTVGDINSVWTPSCQKALSFIFAMRCGYDVPGVHTRCHDDLVSTHGGVSRSFSGGWHDAGDLSQQTLQTADVAHALLELYAKQRDCNPLLAERLLEEARWGLQFVLANRYGDGWHASSVGLLIWQDGIRGSHDDICSVRTQDLAFDNFLYAGYEAHAARTIPDDTVYTDYLRHVAEEDFHLACAKWERDGWQGWINAYEHTYCTSFAQFMATASWAASQLYSLTGNNEYAGLAREYAAYVLRCQETDNSTMHGLAGFFYRDDTHTTPVHFIHQSRDHIFAQALIELCLTQPESPLALPCRKAIDLYASYLRGLMTYTEPYGMIPSGVWRDIEPSDTESFNALHLFAPPDAPQLYHAQLARGTQIAPGYYVRRFPIWFTVFNGNMAVHLATGKAAALCSSFLGDSSLRDIALEQLYWVVGKNPFRQSLIYGEGYRYPSLDNFSSGELTGAMPVGIRALADADVPYWPPINSACYKEVWVSCAGRWLSLLASL